ncbi:hypothetical protein K491DRAFT_116101 [Lophiostoma macrostomum CBS 122681]|uniref:Uncharacterized protein n=1 Tax=Lophiostoma macrostomum CBS 122681 TaxID=1314788 RepID=A0A6A6STH6_9PLEO|nr:hypothetical protein K491DRAFT_116101 [Lophiostoma macrostomum CBS 122681]
MEVSRPPFSAISPPSAYLNSLFSRTEPWPPQDTEMTSSTTSTTLTITDPRIIRALNRGPVTSLFTPPTSCTATLTHRQSATVLFVGHEHDPYFDVSCFPMGTLASLDLVQDLEL